LIKLFEWFVLNFAYDRLKFVRYLNGLF